MQTAAHYDPGVFTRVTTILDAKRIILTPEQHLTTEERWQRETPHVCDLIERAVTLDPGSLVVDYGCGIGRLSREVVARHGCQVIGVDIAANMRGLASSYVASDNFVACSSSMAVRLGVRADLVLAVWVLQHIAQLASELDLIKSILRPGGHLFVINEGSSRFVPSNIGWVHDGLDVRLMLGERFTAVGSGVLDPDVVGPQQSSRTFWASYQKASDE
jgi:SAM-dependent methyltransferase